MFLKVINKKLELDNIFSLILEKPAGFNFYPGQYLDVELSINGKAETRAFTISSSPTENFIMITTKKGVSRFKKTLEKLKIGDNIITSHPAGTFTLDETSQAVFIAGGIGITPFRSMVKYVFDYKLTTPVTLIYLNSGEDFPFKEELDSWREQLKNLTICYINTTKAGRLDKEKLTKIISHTSLIMNQIFYLAGSPKMVDDFASMLISLGIDETNIRYDRFDGY